MLSTETETMKSVLVETEMAWTASWWPWKVWTQLPNKLSQTLTVPSAQPVAKYLEAPIQVRDVTPSCNRKKERSCLSFNLCFDSISEKLQGLYRVVAGEPGSWMLQIPDYKLLVHSTCCSQRDGCRAWWKLHTFNWICMRSQRAHNLYVWLFTS